MMATDHDDHDNDTDADDMSTLWQNCIGQLGVLSFIVEPYVQICLTKISYVFKEVYRRCGQFGIT